MASPTVPHLQRIVGPLADDPLTPEELSILLALPRAAQKTPHALFVRLPKGTTPSDGHYDVSFAQAAAIVARLASAWQTRTDFPLGPGITVCLMIDPFVHGFFHHLAFWALGCTVQYLTGVFGEEMVDGQMRQAGCKLALYLGKTKEWVGARQNKHGIEMFELEESEYAGALVRQEHAGLGPAPEWPTPKRPSPAVVIQSSSTTSIPKVLSFDLHFYAFGLVGDSRRHLASRPPVEFGSTKRPDTHPVLIANDPFWQPFHMYLILHLATATPFALTFPIRTLSVDDFAGWLKEFDAGGIVSAPFLMPGLLKNEEYTRLLQSMYSITPVGCGIDDQLSDLLSEKGIAVHNLFGSSELAGLMTGDRAPYNQLRPIPDFPPPLALPLDRSVQNGITKTNPNREVQLWYIASRCPQLAHVMLRGRMPLKLEPFPGPGPYQGQPATNLGDVFYEIITKEGEDEDVAYVHAARLDDYLRLSNDMDLDASKYEIQFQQLIQSRLETMSDGQWRFDGVQLFGTNLPKTALVVQLLGNSDGPVEDRVVETVRQCVEETNRVLQMGALLQIDPMKRTLITTRTIHGNPSGLCLSKTHKQSLRRWMNVRIFGGWLDGLDWS